MSNVTRKLVLAASVSLLGVAPALAYEGQTSSGTADESANRVHNIDIGLSPGYNRPFAASPAVSVDVARAGKEQRTAAPSVATPGSVSATPLPKQQMGLQQGDYTVINNTVDGQFGP